LSVPVRLLYVDDSPFDRDLVRDALEREHGGFQVVEAASRAEFEARLTDGGYDLVLSDFNILGFEGLQVIDAVHAREPDVPVVIVTGTGSEEIAVAAMRRGAADYVIKTPQHIQRLPMTIHAVLERLQLEAAQARADEQLRYQAAQITQIMRSVPDGVLLLDSGLCVQHANPVAEALLPRLTADAPGAALSALAGRPLHELLTSPPPGQWHELHVGGEVYEVIARPLAADGPAGDGWVLLVRDVTQQRLVQRQYRSQERLAAVGQLASGIAHDFNNLMGVILLYGELLGRSPSLDARDQARLATIMQQVEQATQLIRQILDFSRRGALEQRAVDLRPLLMEEMKLLRRLLPEHIEVVAAWEPEEFFVNADPTRLRQILLNLAVNARDAMPDGGRLTLRLEHVHLHRAHDLPLPSMPLGDWVRFTVADTGVGILPEHLDRVFEPFFTTKAPGLGTGLGLAQVHGIVAQHGGYVGVTSQVNAGTAVAIYLPALAAAMDPNSQPAGVEDLVTGNGELVLVVEDSEPLRAALTSLLQSWRYRTLEAANGAEALACIAESQEPVAVVLSDVVMPQMGGVALLRELRRSALSTPVILLTGHPLDERELTPLRSQGLHGWLLKPPDLTQLAKMLAAALPPPAPA